MIDRVRLRIDAGPRGLEMPNQHASRAILTLLAFAAVMIKGCDVLNSCAPSPQPGSGICGTEGSTCAGGLPEPVPDPRNDGAVDITTFPSDAIPTGIVLNVPNEGRLHVFDDVMPAYTFHPPASGPHIETPADTGFYCDALAEGHWVHSLEHGYIVVLFDDEGDDPLTAGALRGLLLVAPPSPTFGNVKLVVTPYSGLPYKICVVAWNRQLFLDAVDIPAILDFYETFIDQGPEQEE